MNAREYATMIPLIVLAFWIGIYPKPLFRVLDRPVRELVQQVNPGYYGAPALPSVTLPPAAAPSATPDEQPPTSGSTP
jgi:NADH-quinone oxidoreductase subunit M